MESTKSGISGEAPRREGAPATSDGTELVVCVRSYDGEPGSSASASVFGVLLGRKVVAAPVDQGADFHPRAVEVVIAPLPLNWASEVERITASRVDVVVPEGPIAGPAVAFVTLTQPSGHLPEGGGVSQQQLAAAAQETGNLWSVVAQVSVGTTEVEQSPTQVLQRVGDVTATPTVRSTSTSTPEARDPLPVDKHPAPSFEALGVCDLAPWLPRCDN